MWVIIVHGEKGPWVVYYLLLAWQRVSCKPRWYIECLVECPARFFSHIPWIGNVWDEKHERQCFTQCWRCVHKVDWRYCFYQKLYFHEIDFRDDLVVANYQIILPVEKTNPPAPDHFRVINIVALLFLVKVCSQHWSHLMSLEAYRNVLCILC